MYEYFLHAPTHVRIFSCNQEGSTQRGIYGGQYTRKTYVHAPRMDESFPTNKSIQHSTGERRVRFSVRTVSANEPHPVFHNIRRISLDGSIVPTPHFNIPSHHKSTFTTSLSRLFASSNLLLLFRVPQRGLSFPSPFLVLPTALVAAYCNGTHVLITYEKEFDK